LAVHTFAFHDDGLGDNAFPPAHTVDAQGRPLHSWRTLILPHLGEQPLYDRIDLSKPWNDPPNAEPHRAEPKVFRCPSTKAPAGFTTYLAVVAASGFFGAPEPRRVSEVRDGLSTL
jgi:hypothetical protein